MASPKYGGKVSTPQRYLLDITIIIWSRCQIYVWAKTDFHTIHISNVLYFV